MAKKKDITIDSKMKTELKRLRKLEREHVVLKQEHDLLKKPSNTLWIEKRNLRIYRHPPGAIRISVDVSSI